MQGMKIYKFKRSNITNQKGPKESKENKLVYMIV